MKFIVGSTGSSGHARAVTDVVQMFKAAGLRPVGDAGGFRQSVPLRESRVETAGTRFTVRAADGAATPLRFLHGAKLIRS